MIGLYSIRKLLYTLRVSNKTRRLALTLTRYSKKPEAKSDYFSKNDIDELYDLTRSTTERRDLGFVCNAVIPSYASVPDFNEQRRLSGCFFASDRARHEALYFLSANQIVSMLQLVGQGYPSDGRYKHDRDGQWTYKSWTEQ